MAKKIGVILSGCGVYDGSEIHEAVITLLALDRAGAEAVCMAPDAAQLHVVNHLTGEVATGERRNILVEAARIARGKIRNISEITAARATTPTRPLTMTLSIWTQIRVRKPTMKMCQLVRQTERRAARLAFAVGRQVSYTQYMTVPVTAAAP